ncbi:MAG: class I SAM-dependent RNA methyltransferase [Kiritimatiellae bacterium]|nr:class I SAM-dependent RNA methyltransferase [Kiritimatiellia bacterium]
MQVNTGDTLDVTIHEVAYPGRGVARHDDLVYFVPGVLEGETVTIRVTRLRKRYAEADLVEVIKPSPHRIEPTCPLTKDCPGCRYQHMDYAEEVSTKQKQLASLLQRLGGLESLPNIKIIPSPNKLGYRNKIVLHGQQQGEQAVLGYFGKDNRTVLDVDACPLACQAINDAITKVRDSGEVSIPKKDTLSVTFRHTEKEGVSCWHDRPPHGVLLTENTVMGELEVPAGSFFQVNPGVCDALISAIQAIVEQSGYQRVLDLYAGVGVFALAAARAGAPRVIAVDTDRRAIAAARRNAVSLDIHQFRTSAMRADEALNKIASENDNLRDTCIIVDPPRAGLSPNAIEQLKEMNAGCIIYISCAPDNLARDLRKLTAESYTLEDVQLFDMFPRTPHFETLVVLSQK